MTFFVVNLKFLITPRRISILRPYYLKTYHLPLILRPPPLGNLLIYTAKYVQILTSDLILRPLFDLDPGAAALPLPSRYATVSILHLLLLSIGILYLL